nr:hypothetical protein GCM10020093_111110 [Planobispora longispora]
MRPLRRVMTVAALTLGLLLPVSAALAHEERPVTFPDGTGSVPAHRTGEPDLLVCKTDRADFDKRIANFPADLKQRNLELFERCQDKGYRHLQEAVDQVDRAGMDIAILPGVYLEEPSQPEPAGDCAELDARWSSWGYQILSFEQQKQCPHNQNLVAILGIEDLQIEGTGASPLDVIIDAQYKKLNAIRADMTDGIYFRNFTAQRTTFNSLYILATDGFVIDRMLTRWNDEYGFLTFASDHGLYTDCESYGNGDSGIYPGSASDINNGRGHDVPRYSIEIQRCKSHHNMVGYSGTAGDSVYAHDNEFYANMGGASMDSAFPGHPGLPQNHAKFERNKIYDNNQDYYRHVADGTCAKPPAERGYERGVVCPQIGMGTGVITAGGNWNVFRDNWIWGHDEAAFNLLAVPAFIRGEESWDKQFDTSHHNLYEGNRLGVTPAGESRPNGAGVSWDGQGGGNCWQRDAGPSTPGRCPPAARRDRPASSASRSRSPRTTCAASTASASGGCRPAATGTARPAWPGSRSSSRWRALSSSAWSPSCSGAAGSLARRAGGHLDRAGGPDPGRLRGGVRIHGAARRGPRADGRVADRGRAAGRERPGGQEGLRLVHGRARRPHPRRRVRQGDRDDPAAAGRPRLDPRPAHRRMDPVGDRPDRPEAAPRGGSRRGPAGGPRVRPRAGRRRRRARARS